MTTYDDRASLTDLTAVVERVRGSVEDVIEGKPEVVRLSLTVLLAEGHLLIEDVPGVGKTMLAKALARSIDCSVRRIQFTPDLLPSDITGVSIWDQQRRDFEFKPGAIFAQVVIGDEINRASPKTQSALLESMEERQVTIDGQSYELPSPFMVVATQNPVEMEGTYPLPEAQRDRFMARVSIGYPSPDAELQMLDVHGGVNPLDDLQPVAHADEILKLIEAVRGVHVADPVRRYAVDLVAATRTHPDLRLGASPRATLHLLRAAKASAALSGREYALPDDVQALAVAVLAHRLLPTAQAQLARRSAEQVVQEILQRTPVPAAPSSSRATAWATARRRTAGRHRGGCDGRRGDGPVDGGRGSARRHPHRPDRPDHPWALLPRRRDRGRGLRLRPRAERPAPRRPAAGSAAPDLRDRAVPHAPPGGGQPPAVPGRVPAGSEARVHLRVDNVSRLPTGLLMLQDRVPYVLGPRPRFVLDRVEPGGRREVSYRVRSDLRGRYPLGPLQLRLTDPFGLCELTRSFSTYDTLTVTPRVEALPPVRLSGEAKGYGEGRQRSLALAGDDDVIPAGTATATTCAACTGGPPRGTAS